MYDKPVILIGLVAGLALLTFPLWYTQAAGSHGAAPQLELPKGHCVEDTEYMRAHHMELLDRWRNEVVREGDNAPYVSQAFGTKYEKSLTKTCMGCHTNRETFCYRCHEYANVSSLHLLSPCPGDPTPERGIVCWDCHQAESKRIASDGR
jgi:hypothetical protein